MWTIREFDFGVASLEQDGGRRFLVEGRSLS